MKKARIFLGTIASLACFVFFVSTFYLDFGCGEQNMIYSPESILTVLVPLIVWQLFSGIMPGFIRAFKIAFTKKEYKAVDIKKSMYALKATFVAAILINAMQVIISVSSAFFNSMGVEDYATVWAPVTWPLVVSGALVAPVIILILLPVYSELKFSLFEKEEN
ncbi:MAG: hypothetical protein K6D96_05080 [Acetatifactor sp.]|nr:hypothetical protein [Acetatifactor sp.]